MNLKNATKRVLYKYTSVHYSVYYTNIYELNLFICIIQYEYW